MKAIFAASIFLAAFLLFQVQPIVGKYILPLFGGTSFVWITSLLFFQTLLLAGYLYSFLLTKLQLKRQVHVHALLIFFISCVVLFAMTTLGSPITPVTPWRISTNISPFLQVLFILTLTVALPYFLLSTTSTLLQRWFSHKETKKSPYSLYSISNAGSLLGIISYPFLIEPALKLNNQGFIWSISFLVLCSFLLVSCFLTLKFSKKILANKHHVPSPTIAKKSYFLWFALPALSSWMLLTGTNEMTQAIAPMPFLWLLPLGVYLLSFIFAFSDYAVFKTHLFTYGFLVSVLFLVSVIQPLYIPLIFKLVLFTFSLFFCFMFLHIELYRSRPEPEHLNIFYLIIAFGSVVGAGIVALIAPLFFKALFVEFYLGLYLVTITAWLIFLADKKSGMYRFLAFMLPGEKERKFFIMFFCIGFFGFLLVVHHASLFSSTIQIWRNFYGTLRITTKDTKNGKAYCLINGTIIHGCQYTSATLVNTPTMYYGEKSGLGLAFRSIQQKNEQMRIGAIGLGVGTIAAYAKQGDYVRFYELNPVDIEIAKNYFTYIKNSKATIDFVAGDGRLSLEKELQENTSGNFNMLIIDAYNDDAIPVHLLTKEAFAVYRKHLAPQSILAVHVSTTYLDLTPVIVRIAKEFSLDYAYIYSKGDKEITSTSKWVLLSADPALLNTSDIVRVRQQITKKAPLWTDDYSNIFQLLK